MNNIEIFNETNEVLESYIIKMKEALLLTLKEEKVTNVEFNVIITTEERIHTLNKTYRNIDSPTDVISFALEDEKESFIQYDKRVLGDIYICSSYALKQAPIYGFSYEEEMLFLAIHGLLHLLGYDHQESNDERIMFTKQERILKEVINK